MFFHNFTIIGSKYGLWTPQVKTSRYCFAREEKCFSDENELTSHVDGDVGSRGDRFFIIFGPAKVGLAEVLLRQRGNSQRVLHLLFLEAKSVVDDVSVGGEPNETRQRRSEGRLADQGQGHALVVGPRDPPGGGDGPLRVQGVHDERGFGRNDQRHVHQRIARLGFAEIHATAEKAGIRGGNAGDVQRGRGRMRVEGRPAAEPERRRGAPETGVWSASSIVPNIIWYD